MLWSHLILFTSWLAYGLLHSVLATSVVKKNIQSALKLSDSNYRLFYNIIALVTLVLLVFVALRIDSFPVFTANHASVIIAIVLLATGLSIMAYCIAGYFRQMSGLKDAVPELKINGLNNYVRHPLYLGTFIFLAGIFFIRPLYSILVSVLPVMIYTIRALQWEEQKLLVIFGEAYKDYQKSTPAIFPSLPHLKKRK